MSRHLILRLEAPLMSFGGVAVDNYGVIDEWPSASLLTGLLGNALAYRRTDADALQLLQDRLHFACRRDRTGDRLRDFQTAELAQNDKGWTTRGVPEGRAGGAGTYAGMHLRYRDFWADRLMIVALRLEPAGEEPILDRLAEALDRPARPLFIGRKPCLPVGRLFAGWQEAETALAAVSAVVPDGGTAESPVFWWPEGAGESAPFRSRAMSVYGSRNWRSGVHGGASVWYEGVPE